MVGAKIITLFDVVLNVCKENYIINGEGERMKRSILYNSLDLVKYDNRML